MGSRLVQPWTTAVARNAALRPPALEPASTSTLGMTSSSRHRSTYGFGVVSPPFAARLPASTKRRTSSTTPPIQIARLTPPFNANANLISVAIPALLPAHQARRYHGISGRRPGRMLAGRAAVGSSPRRRVSAPHGQEFQHAGTTSFLALPQRHRPLHLARVPVAEGVATRSPRRRTRALPTVRRRLPRLPRAGSVRGRDLPARRSRRVAVGPHREDEAAPRTGRQDRAPAHTAGPRGRGCVPRRRLPEAIPAGVAERSSPPRGPRRGGLRRDRRVGGGRRVRVVPAPGRR